MTEPLHVYWANLHEGAISRGYWDDEFIEDILRNQVWTISGAPPVVHHEDSDLTDFQGGVVVIPARHNASKVRVIADRLSRAPWALCVLTGDEEHTFDASVLPENAIVWTMHPGPHSRGNVFIGSGYTPFTRQYLPVEPPDKGLSWFFSGQITHERRQQCADALDWTLNDTQGGGRLVRTPGFTQGLDPAYYIESLVRAKIAPCPSGPVSVDNFRLYEALEAGCLPLVDGRTPAGDEHWYWGKVHPFSPLVVVDDWSSVGAHIVEQLAKWPACANEVFAWWQQYKRELAYTFWSQVATLRGEQLDVGKLTAIITTSPVDIHPDTSHLEETVQSVRERIGNADILIVFDGIKPEQQHHAEAYNEYVRRVCWMANTRWTNVLPIVCKEYGHQANTTRCALDYVKTDHILFSEHDTPLVGDTPFDELCDVLDSGEANIIRLHHEASVLPPHEHLMLDTAPRDVLGVPMRRTVQWSQRPHLSLTRFYREMLDRYFARDSRTMIEDVMYGVVNQAWNVYGMPGWAEWKLWLYTPEGDIKRSWHLDSRGEEDKYPMVWSYPNGGTPEGAPRSTAEREQLHG